MKTFILVLLSILNLYLGILSGAYFSDYAENHIHITLFETAMHTANSIMWFLSLVAQMAIAGPVLLGQILGFNVLKK